MYRGIDSGEPVPLRMQDLWLRNHRSRWFQYRFVGTSRLRHSRTARVFAQRRRFCRLILRRYIILTFLVVTRWLRESRSPDHLLARTLSCVDLPSELESKSARSVAGSFVCSTSAARANASSDQPYAKSNFS